MAPRPSHVHRGRLLVKTLFENPRGTGKTSLGHQLMIRAGLIKREDSGIFTFLPPLLKSLGRLESLVDRHLEGGLNAHKISLPLLTSSKLWEQSGRWDQAGDELFRLKDRSGNDMCLAATAEETATSLVKSLSLTHKDLPLRTFQVGRKYRDEARPRFGLLRGREFVMKDMYTFDRDEESAVDTYRQVCDLYERLLPAALGLDASVVRVAADSGMIGGSLSHEYHVLHSVGEDTILTCDTCGTSSNVELTPRITSNDSNDTENNDNSKSFRDNVVDDDKSVADMTYVICLGSRKTILGKYIVFSAPGKEVSLCKVRRMVPGAVEVNAVSLERFQREDTPGEKVSVLFDQDLNQATKNAILHRNDADVDYDYNDETMDGRIDMENPVTGDFVSAAEGDPCATCGTGSSLVESRGVELGHSFMLGTKYSEPLGGKYHGSDGKFHTMWMGCYGIGLTRILALAVELGAKGDSSFVWPASIAPYRVGVIDLSNTIKGGSEKNEVSEAALAIASGVSSGIEGLGDGTVVLDDGPARPGSKFRDADLLGYPITVTIGKKFSASGEVEFTDRRSDTKRMIPITAVNEAIEEAFDGDMIHF